MYLKKPFDETTADELRINLSARSKKMSPEPVCDFCGKEPLFVYAANRLTTGEFKRCWRWCACEVCSNLLDSENWNDLINRMAERAHDVFHMPVKFFAVPAAEYAEQFKLYAVKEGE